MKEINFFDIKEIKIGHAQNEEAATGCTVIIAEKGATAGVDVRGGAPGTRETDLLKPGNLVDKVHAVFLTGGSAFGLNIAAGIMQYLEERDIGFDVQVAKVPIIPGAVLFDLGIGSADVRPDKEMGYKACLNASSKELLMGNVGAGTGATVGKFFGMKRSMKGGLGTYFLQVGDLKIGAVVAVNCFGDVIEPESGEILAGTLNDDMKTLANTEKLMINQYDNKKDFFNGNTTLGVVTTNARLTKTQANKVVSMAHNGYGRTIRPAHSMVDGDTIFTLATGRVDADINVIGLLAARVIEKAVVRAVKSADSFHGIRSYSEIQR